MSRGVKQKWRPPLILVVAGVLLPVLILPVFGLTTLRLAGNILGWLETAQLFGLLAFVVTLLLAFLLWRLVLRPVWALTRHARAMKTGRSDIPPPTRFGTSEFSELGRSVIDMGEALNARARSLSAYADHVTHELKSPLTSLRGAAEMLKDPGLPPEDRLSLITTIDVSAARMETLLNELKGHAAARLEASPGKSTLDDALNCAHLPEEIEIIAQSQAVWPISAADLGRVITQLARNAAEAGAQKLTLQEQNGTLVIRDDGPGIPLGDRARVFDPFFTSRRDAGGTGMGLSIARTLVEAAGGRLTLLDTGPGTHFRLRF